MIVGSNHDGWPVRNELRHADPFERFCRHFCDLDFDVTTGVRFRSIEILLSLLIRFAAIVIPGPPVVAVVIFGVVLNALSMFGHGNVRLLDRLVGTCRPQLRGGHEILAIGIRCWQWEMRP